MFGHRVRTLRSPRTDSSSQKLSDLYSRLLVIFLHAASPVGDETHPTALGSREIQRKVAGAAGVTQRAWREGRTDGERVHADLCVFLLPEVERCATAVTATVMGFLFKCAATSWLRFRAPGS